jgi:hypothetical protein
MSQASSVVVARDLPPASSAGVLSTGRTVLVGGLGLVFGAALVVGGLYWPDLNVSPLATDLLGRLGAAEALTPATHPLVQGFELVSAALIGLFVTLVYRQLAREKPLGRAMEQAQVLLCVAGAMIMIIIGSSIARAFGIAGAASIIRFRTPVDDPKDITVLFLLMALGMAVGLGAFAVAGLGTLCLVGFLVLLEKIGDSRPRRAVVELVSQGPDFPAAHIDAVFGRHGIASEVREVTRGSQVKARYAATLAPSLSLNALNEDLMAHAALASVSWDTKKQA